MRCPCWPARLFPSTGKPPPARPGIGNEFFKYPGPFFGLVFAGVVEFLDEQPGAQPVRDELRVERVVQLRVEHFLFFGFHRVG